MIHIFEMPHQGCICLFKISMHGYWKYLLYGYSCFTKFIQCIYGLL